MSGEDWPDQPSPRFIFHRLFRRKDLCPTPPMCPEVLMEDPYANEDALPCLLCPAQFLSDFLESPGGRLISVVLDLDYAIQVGIAVRMDQISYMEFLLLRQLSEERSKFETEEIRKAQNKRN